MSALTVEQLYQDMYDHTKRECGNCRIPYSCCNKGQCEFTIQHAFESWGVELKPTGHPKLPLMGENGCVAAPHLRPLCTVHTCSVMTCGGKLGDEAWTERYHELRDQINDLEAERMFGDTND